MKVYINGKYYDKDDAKVSVFDHGFLYGDGIFEGIRLYSGNVFKLDKHIDRLFRSAKAIMLDMPWSKQQIIDAVCDACRTNGLQDGYIRLVGNLLAPRFIFLFILRLVAHGVLIAARLLLYDGKNKGRRTFRLTAPVFD